MDNIDDGFEVYALYWAVKSLWSSVLCGNQNQKQKEIYEIMKKVDVGSFVMENSSGFLAVREFRNGNIKDSIDHLKCMFGFLDRVCFEEIDLSEEVRNEYKDSGEEIPKQKVFYIKNLHGNEFRWHNADFITVPVEYL